MATRSFDFRLSREGSCRPRTFLHPLAPEIVQNSRRHTRVVLEFGIKYVPRVRTVGVNVHGRLIPFRLIKTRGRQEHQLGPVRFENAERRSALDAEPAVHGLAALRNLRRFIDVRRRNLLRSQLSDRRRALQPQSRIAVRVEQESAPRRSCRQDMAP